VAALQAAEVTGRPLLLRGDPGNGKSQTARAAAVAAGRPFVSVVIDGRTEANDLKWRFDAVARLADAQVRRDGVPLPQEAAYLSPGPLWWAYQWRGAQQRLDTIHAERPHQVTPPAALPVGWRADKDRVVLLIDEIDKADPDLPNALLEILANLGFREPYGGGEIRCSESTRPLVILTTNEERELPHAFLRRCMVHSLNLPNEREALVERLVALGRQHQKHLPGRKTCHVMQTVAEYVADARARLGSTGLYMPGTSEFLDLVGAVAAMARTKREQEALLDQIAPFSLDKAGPRRR
jgi:MoxR-like ATPase